MEISRSLRRSVLYGFRLDLGFTGKEESFMTFNPEGLFVELNMSNDVDYLDTIMKYQPNKNKRFIATEGTFLTI